METKDAIAAPSLLIPYIIKKYPPALNKPTAMINATSMLFGGATKVPVIGAIKQYKIVPGSDT